jgi:HK97 family phage major capsid protein
MDPLEQKLTDLSTEVKAFAAKAKEEVTNLGAVQTETKTALDAIRTQLLAQQTQLDAVDAKTQQRHAPGGPEQKSLGTMLTEAPEYAAAKERGFMGKTPLNIGLKSGVPMERKTNITDATLGGGTSGLLMPTRLPGVYAMAQQALRIRDVMNVTTQGEGNSFDYVYQVTRTNATSPQVEAAAKAQSYLNWTSGERHHPDARALRAGIPPGAR